MKIAFAKIGSEPTNISFALDGVSFEGFLKRKNSEQVLASGKLKGTLSHLCDSCGKELELGIDEDLELILNDGQSNESSLDIVEFYDGFIDLHELVSSELESIKSDYFYCKECKTKQGE